MGLMEDPASRFCKGEGIFSEPVMPLWALVRERFEIFRGLPNFGEDKGGHSWGDLDPSLEG